MGHMQGGVTETLSVQGGEWNGQQAEQGLLGERVGLLGSLGPFGICSSRSISSSSAHVSLQRTFYKCRDFA